MTNYAPLVAIWPTLDSGTTQDKLAQLNAQTVTGSVPTQFSVMAVDIYNCLDPGFWITLNGGSPPAAGDPVKTALVRDILSFQGLIPIGEGTLANFVMTYVFGSSAETETALAKLAQGVVQPWYTANGFLAPINMNDLVAAGNLT